MATTKLGDVYPIIIDKYESFVPLNGGVDMIEKINSVVEHLNRLGQLTTETVNQWNKVMKWVNADGLTDSVNAKIDDLIAKGMFDELLNGMMDDLNTANTTFQNSINSQETTFQNTVNSQNTAFQNTINGQINTLTTSISTKANQSSLDTTNANVTANTNALVDITSHKAGWLNLTQAPSNADKTGVTDCATIINNAITSNGATMGVYLPVGTYLISSPIIIPTNALFICEGTIKYTGTGNAIEFRGTYANVKINKILCTSATGGNGVVFNPVSSMVAYNEIYINHIECNGYGIYLDGSTYGSGIQHNKIKFNQLWNCQYGIYLLCNTGWIGENVFDCGRIGIESKVSTIGIYIQDAGTNSITGSKFYHPALEGCTEGILIQSGGSCMIADIRAEESITSNVVRIIGGPKATITSETIYINKIDLTACTGTHVKIKGTILASDGSPIATELRSNSANKRIKLLYRNYANCTTATYTVTDDKPTYYFWTTSATTLNLNQYYGDYGIEDFIVRFGVGTSIYDSTSTLIYDGTAQAGKTYLFRKINQSTVGTNGWLAQQIG
jgi:hypothetical protein